METLIACTVSTDDRQSLALTAGLLITVSFYKIDPVTNKKALSLRIESIIQAFKVFFILPQDG